MLRITMIQIRAGLISKRWRSRRLGLDAEIPDLLAPSFALNSV